MRVIVKLVDNDKELILDGVKRWEWAACAYFVEITGTGRRWRFRADRVEWVQVVKGDQEETPVDNGPRYIPDPPGYCPKHGYESKCECPERLPDSAG